MDEFNSKRIEYIKTKLDPIIRKATQVRQSTIAPLRKDVNIALNVIKEEKLAENAQLMGEVFRARLQDFADNNNIVTKVRGKGLLNAIVINDKEGSDIAWNICLNMAEKGLLAKPTHGNIIRFAPPLIINRKELDDCIDIIISSLKEFEV